MVNRRGDLTAPRARRRRTVQYDSDAIGRISETVARNFGTGRFLVIQTGLVILGSSSTSRSWRCSGTHTRSSC